VDAARSRAGWITQLETWKRWLASRLSLARFRELAGSAIVGVGDRGEVVVGRSSTPEWLASDWSASRQGE